MKYLEWLVGHELDLRSTLLGAAILAIATYVYRTVRVPLSKGIKWAVAGLLYNLSALMSATAASALTLGNYCRLQLAGANRFLIVPGAQDISLDIDRIFVPLSLEKGGDTLTYNHDTILMQGNRLRIIGDPGSGKSSIAKKIFREQCKKNDRIIPRGSMFRTVGTENNSVSSEHYSQ
jgi:hypothetical protein